MLLLDKDESPECHSLPFIPVTIVFLCSLPWAQISSRLVESLWQGPVRHPGWHRGRQEALSRAASVSGSLRSEQPGWALNWSLLLPALLRIQKRGLFYLVFCLCTSLPGTTGFQSWFLAKGALMGEQLHWVHNICFTQTPFHTRLTSPENHPSFPILRWRGEATCPPANVHLGLMALAAAALVI